jgi:hypothetical protein
LLANLKVLQSRNRGAFINIGNAGTVGSRPVHNPNYDFNDEAIANWRESLRTTGGEKAATSFRYIISLLLIEPRAGPFRTLPVFM